MAEKDKATSQVNADIAKTALSESEDVVYMPLKVFADTHALKYGIELMAGFFHVQEREKHFADTEGNWHSLMDQFKDSEVE